MAAPLATVATIAVSIVLLYVLIKGHLYVIRRVWRPIWKEELEAEDEEGEGEGEGEEEGEREGEEGGERRAWDHVR